MCFRLVQKSVTLNDLERRNGHYFALFPRFGSLNKSLDLEFRTFCTHCIKVSTRSPFSQRGEAATNFKVSNKCVCVSLKHIHYNNDDNDAKKNLCLAPPKGQY